jgi:murein L,D-transpeptidase YcbB/YkuD
MQMRPGGGIRSLAAHRRKPFALAFVIAALVATSANSAPNQLSALFRRDVGAAEDGRWATQSALRDMLQSPGPDSSVGAFPPSVRNQLRTFYDSRGFRPVWNGGSPELERAEEALGVLAHAEDHGLNREDYSSPAEHKRKGPRSGREAAEYEIALTEAMLRYVRDVSIGRVRPADVYRDVQLPDRRFDAVEMLSRMVRGTSLAASLAELPPTHPQYLNLAQALARYRTIAVNGGWPMIKNDSDAAVVAERMALEDPLLARQETPSPDEMRKAIERFQSRNGLAADGRLSPATVAALNVPVAKRIDQIAANMERWRWLPRRFEDRYIAVNVPDQSLKYIRDGKTELSSRVIVGRTVSTTPILYTAVTGVIANPDWPIPGDIVVNQLLPKLRRNPRHLAANNMVLANGPANDPQGVRINWRNVSAAEFPYRVVQLPGATNGLGQVMLDSPNDFDIYLHDTPAKGIFRESMRAVSNGCVRVEAIRPLAALTLEGIDPEQRIADAIKSGTTQRLPLDRPLPVYFLYWTAIAADDGTVGYRRDFYTRDDRLIRALAAPPEERDEPTAVASDQIAPGVARVNDTFLPAMESAGAITEPPAERRRPSTRSNRTPPRQLASNEQIEPTRLSGRTVRSPAPQARSATSPIRRAEMAPLFPRLRRWLDGLPPTPRPSPR